MNFPQELKYTKSHEWVKFEEDGKALVGLSDYAQDAQVGSEPCRFVGQGVG